MFSGRGRPSRVARIRVFGWVSQVSYGAMSIPYVRSIRSQTLLLSVVVGWACVPLDPHAPLTPAQEIRCAEDAPIHPHEASAPPACGRRGGGARTRCRCRPAAAVRGCGRGGDSSGLECRGLRGRRPQSRRRSRICRLRRHELCALGRGAAARRQRPAPAAALHRLGRGARRGPQRRECQRLDARLARRQSHDPEGRARRVHGCAGDHDDGLQPAGDPAGRAGAESRVAWPSTSPRSSAR